MESGGQSFTDHLDLLATPLRRSFAIVPVLFLSVLEFFLEFSHIDVPIVQCISEKSIKGDGGL